MNKMNSELGQNTIDLDFKIEVEKLGKMIVSILPGAFEISVIPTPSNIRHVEVKWLVHQGENNNEKVCESHFIGVQIKLPIRKLKTGQKVIVSNPKNDAAAIMFAASKQLFNNVFDFVFFDC